MAMLLISWKSDLSWISPICGESDSEITDILRKWFSAILRTWKQFSRRSDFRDIPPICWGSVYSANSPICWRIRIWRIWINALEVNLMIGWRSDFRAILPICWGTVSLKRRFGSHFSDLLNKLFRINLLANKYKFTEQAI